MDGINFNLHINDLFRVFNKLRHVHDRYTPYFLSKTRNSATQSFKHIQGTFLKAWAQARRYPCLLWLTPLNAKRSEATPEGMMVMDIGCRIIVEMGNRASACG